MYVNNKNERDIVEMADAITGTGIKGKEAYHVACAIKV